MKQANNTPCSLQNMGCFCILAIFQEGVTEQLKATDQMKWVQLMNNIHNRAEQIVNYGAVYT